MIVEHIIKHLATDIGITDIVGSSPYKIFPGEAPKQAGSTDEVRPPYISIIEGGGDRVRAMEGQTGTRILAYDIICVGTSKLQVGDLYELVSDRLDSADNEYWDTLWVHYSECTEGQDISEKPTDGSQSKTKIMFGILTLTCET